MRGGMVLEYACPSQLGHVCVCVGGGGGGVNTNLHKAAVVCGGYGLCMGEYAGLSQST